MRARCPPQPLTERDRESRIQEIGPLREAKGLRSVLLKVKMEGDSKMRTPTFSGKPEDFHLWWMRFTAFATVMKFAKALNGPEAKLPGKESDPIDTSTTDGKAAEAAKTRNMKAMAHFTIAFTKERLVTMRYTSMTADWPSGLVHTVVSKLKLRIGHALEAPPSVRMT